MKDGIPGLGYDWFNYGGITRDVNLVETNETYIDDYLIQLKKHSLNEVKGWVQLAGIKPNQTVRVMIPELKINFKTKTDITGLAEVVFRADFKLWSPSTPKLYTVIIQSQTDTISEQ